jgi:hypothetical protein
MMKRMLGLLLTAFIMSSPAAFAQSSKDVDDALATAKELASLPTYGFASQSDIDHFQFSTPFGINNVGLSSLKQWQPGGTAAGAITATGGQFYPVLSGGRVVAEVDMRQLHGRWTLVSFSRNDVKNTAPIAAPAEAIREDLMASTKLPANQFFLVNIPAMGMHFVGYKVGVQLYLAPLFTYVLHSGKKQTLAAGKAMAAEDCFKLLQPDAGTVRTTRICRPSSTKRRLEWRHPPFQLTAFGPLELFDLILSHVAGDRHRRGRWSRRASAT